MNQGTISAQLRMAIPTALCGFLMLLAATPSPFSWLPVYPNILVISLFFFVLYAPDALPLLAVFFLGLLADIIFSAPIGLHATLAVLARQVLVPLRRILSRQAFRVLWAAFAVLACLYMLAAYLVVSAMGLEEGSLAHYLPYVGSTILFYPVLHHLYAQVLKFGTVS